MHMHAPSSKSSEDNAISVISSEGVLATEGTVNGDRFYDFLRGMMQPFNGTNAHSIYGQLLCPSCVRSKRSASICWHI